MVHGDEQGLVLPPKVAPTQVILVPVGPWQKEPRDLRSLEGIKVALAQKVYVFVLILRIIHQVTNSTSGN